MSDLKRKAPIYLVRWDSSGRQMLEYGFAEIDADGMLMLRRFAGDILHFEPGVDVEFRRITDSVLLTDYMIVPVESPERHYPVRTKEAKTHA